jgi:aerotaxis receptor
MELSMRSNLPVTNREYVLKDWETIVSKTDLKGRITYVNTDFVRISGFSEDELLGKPHNIVRHPEMPTEAFEDMWRTLKNGKAWTGIVKNRCKNGDHYWVEANAAPLIENHEVVGYTSIRGKPSTGQINAADGAYRAIQSGSKRLVIREGNAVARSSLGFLKAIRNLSISTRLLCWFGAIIALFAANGALAWLALESGDRSLAIGAAGVAGAVLLIRIGRLEHERFRKTMSGERFGCSSCTWHGDSLRRKQSGGQGKAAGRIELGQGCQSGFGHQDAVYGAV